MGREVGSSMNRILVCLDASPRAAYVLATATDLARRAGGRMSLLRTIGIPPEIDQTMFVRAEADMIETMLAQAKRDLLELAKGVPPELLEGIHVHVGTPWDAICREAKVLDSDLVVLGSHGYSGIDHILGTTAAKVVNHCERSVLVVRQPPRAKT